MALEDPTTAKMNKTHGVRDKELWVCVIESRGALTYTCNLPQKLLPFHFVTIEIAAEQLDLRKTHPTFYGNLFTT